MPNLNQALENSLNTVFEKARNSHHKFFTLEHLMIAVMHDQSGKDALRSCDINLPKLIRQFEHFVDESTPTFQDDQEETQLTLGVHRVLRQAARMHSSSDIDGAHLLEAVFSEEVSNGVSFLKEVGIDQTTIQQYLNKENKNKLRPRHRISNHQSLHLFAVNLNQKAIEHKIESLIGREKELETVIEILSQRRKNNPLLIGEPGVGKTAVVEGLAQKIVDKKVPDSLLKSTIYALDIGSLLAGAKYRGEFEARLKSVLNDLKEDPNAILFIDEIHSIIGAGIVLGSSLDAANIIKPLLSSGELTCIGSTTYKEYKNIFEKDQALSRRFQTVKISEPSADETLSILQGMRKYFEQHHHLRYTDAALVTAVKLSERYLKDRYFPDKALDLLDEAGAHQHLLNENFVTDHTVETILARTLNIPEITLSNSDELKIKNLEDHLKHVIFGQDQAITSVVNVVKLARSGLRETQKVSGAFLFAGPTGVGKTELAKQLAYFMNIELIRFDMSEYSESHSVAKLIGSPPGYVGFDEGGLLTNRVQKSPYSVVLLDELEKAHTDIYNILLQVMDYGYLTDNQGRKVDFSHSILLMTTNAGAKVASRSSIGFTLQNHASDGVAELNLIFSPEFRNRLDGIICFNPLDASHALEIVSKFLNELENQLAAKNVQLWIDDRVTAWIAKHGIDQQMGARPLSRLIQEKIKQPLADELLFGKLKEGGKIQLTVDESTNDLSFLYLEM